MKRKRRGILVLSLCLLLAGCAQGTGTVEETEKPGEEAEETDESGEELEEFEMDVSDYHGDMIPMEVEEEEEERTISDVSGEEE